ncbi:hypothetical protein HY988_02390 [Candidatus Micrarchaeota archaeon]|nr:hypothetical protein [Candidatus Micrarchaeota archaeon]
MGITLEIEYTKNGIKLDKVLSIIDRFTLDFIKILDRLDIKYVLISGYVVLLFGRQRMTEDIDIFLEELDKERLKGLFDALEKDWWLINARSYKMAKMLYGEGSAWRAAKKDTIAPNMEMKNLQNFSASEIR